MKKAFLYSIKSIILFGLILGVSQGLYAQQKLKNSIPGADEYVNDISLDGKTIYLTIRSVEEVREDGFVIYREDLYQARLYADSVADYQLIELPKGFQGRVGAATFSSDKRYLFFTVAYHEDGKGSCDLYYMDLQSERPRVFNLGNKINTREWDAQASFSADGKTLYFASKREGGYGGSDIWYTELNKDGYFEEALNAGPKINTKEDEMAPFIYADTKTLYFSSKGHEGMGGYDLYVSKKVDGKWTKAQNLGDSINTEFDEINLVIAPNGKDAYLSKKEKDFDIYHFKLNNSELEPVKFIVGKIVDSDTKLPLEAKLILTELKQNKVLSKAQSLKNGNFRMVLPTKDLFALHIQKEGYLFYSKSYDHAFVQDTLYIELSPLKLNAKLTLSNIFFEKDKYELLPESNTELERIFQFMNQNPTLRFEISGHTDNTGTAEYNQTLSEKRAMAVYDSLIKLGIDKSRLSYRGYGESRHVGMNDTEEHRALNRRTEFKIIAIK